MCIFLGYSAPVQGRSVIFPNMIAFVTPSVYRTIRSNSHNSLYLMYFSVGVSTRRVIYEGEISVCFSTKHIFDFPLLWKKMSLPIFGVFGGV